MTAFSKTHQHDTMSAYRPSNTSASQVSMPVSIANQHGDMWLWVKTPEQPAAEPAIELGISKTLPDLAPELAPEPAPEPAPKSLLWLKTHTLAVGERTRSTPQSDGLRLSYCWRFKRHMNFKEFNRISWFKTLEFTLTKRQSLTRVVLGSIGPLNHSNAQSMNQANSFVESWAVTVVMT